MISVLFSVIAFLFWVLNTVTLKRRFVNHKIFDLSSLCPSSPANINFFLHLNRKCDMVSDAYAEHLYMPLWRNWQTHLTQNQAGNTVPVRVRPAASEKSRVNGTFSISCCISCCFVLVKDMHKMLDFCTKYGTIYRNEELPV